MFYLSATDRRNEIIQPVPLEYMTTLGDSVSHACVADELVRSEASSCLEFDLADMNAEGPATLTFEGKGVVDLGGYRQIHLVVCVIEEELHICKDQSLLYDSVVRCLHLDRCLEDPRKLDRSKHCHRGSYQRLPRHRIHVVVYRTPAVCTLVIS